MAKNIRTLFYRIGLVVFFISAVILALPKQEADVQEALKFRIFYGTISGITSDVNGIYFKVKMSDIPNGYEPTFVVNDPALKESMREFRIGDSVKVESEYDENKEGPDFQYPVLTITLITDNPSLS